MGQRYTQYVNPLIGTGGHGHVFLGANVPFGYVQLGPTEPTQGWDWCSGYHASDSIIVGFGHQHLSGTGIGELGDVAFLPVSCCKQTEVKFAHESENVAPGYYSVKLKDPNVLVELTATQRAGFQRYTTGADVRRGMVRLDLHQGIGWDKMSKAKYRQVDDRTVCGYRESTGWARHQYTFFYAEFNKPIKLKRDQDSIVVFTYEPDSTPLLIKTGLSAVSEDNARENLHKEIPGWDFNAVVRQADEAWEKQLSRVQIKTDDEDARTIFYTALYHTMTAPSVFCDVNGQYRGADLQVHEGQFTNYTTFSLWDTYRAAHHLLTLIHPEKVGDLINTMLRIHEQQGKLPVWHLMGCETDCMVGNPGIPALADAVLKGYGGFDREQAYEALKQSAMLGERGMDLRMKYGYIPCDLFNEAVAYDMEYALADWAVAQVAKELGKTADYDYFLERSKSYRHFFDPQTRFMRGLDSKGRFRTPFNPFASTHREDDYCEGNAWQYTWLVPHDVEGLIGCFGGKEAFTGKLDSLFVVSSVLEGAASPDISGLIGQYAHGNEPSHHVVYLYTMIGQPWKTADKEREILTTLYHDQPDGLSGNEDVGQMSAWYVLSSLGFYQVEPAGGRYFFGSPLFDRAEVRVRDGVLTVTAHNNSAANKYIQAVKLNGKPYTKPYIAFDDIAAGGRLEFEMGAQPAVWYEL